MANHKRHRPKNARAGCLMCKPHKANGTKGGAVALLPRDARRLDPIPSLVAEAADDPLLDLLERYESEDARLYCSDELDDFVRYLDRAVR